MIDSDVTHCAQQVALLICDVDGVLTNGSICVTDNGQELKFFNIQDGHGIRMLMHHNIHFAVISARSSQAVIHRMRDLQVKHVYQGNIDKRNALLDLMTILKVNFQQIAYVGDDVVDLQIMKDVGLPIAVANAHPFVKRHAKWLTQKNGGDGAVREVCELILESKGLLQQSLAHYLQ